MKISMNSSNYDMDINFLQQKIDEYVNSGVMDKDLSKINEIKDIGDALAIKSVLNGVTALIMYSKDDEKVTDIMYYLADEIPVSYWHIGSGKVMAQLDSILRENPGALKEALEWGGSNGFPEDESRRFKSFSNWLKAYGESAKQIRNERELEKVFKDKYGWSGDIKIQRVEPMADDYDHTFYYVTIDGMTCWVVWNKYKDILYSCYILMGDTKINFELYKDEWKESIQKLYSLSKKDKSISSLKKAITEERELEWLLNRYDLAGDISGRIKRAIIWRYDDLKDSEIKDISVYDEDEDLYSATIDGMPCLITWGPNMGLRKGYILIGIGKGKIDLALYNKKNKRNIQKLYSKVQKDKSLRDSIKRAIEWQEELNYYLDKAGIIKLPD